MYFRANVGLLTTAAAFDPIDLAVCGKKTGSHILMPMFLVRELLDQEIDSGIRRCKGNVGMLRQLQSQLKVPYFLVLFVQSGSHFHQHSIELGNTLL